MDELIDNPEWRAVRYLCDLDEGPPDAHVWRHTLNLPVPLADWDVWAYWERSRTTSIETILHEGDVLYDVGTEHGWLSVVYAQTVGPDSMVLVEPSTKLWPNIAATWTQNLGRPPLASAHCLLGDTPGRQLPATHLTPGEEGWPAASEGWMCGATAYTYLHYNPTNVPAVTLDQLVTQVGKPPTGVTMDVEGAEMRVLCGAVNVLDTYRPYVWVSIHPDLGARDYGLAPGAVQEFMGSHGYSAHHLGTDHEEHWLFRPQELTP